MIIYSKFLYFFRVFLIFVLILSLFSCNMSSQQKKKGNKRAGYVLELLDNKDNVISTLLLSNNLVNTLLIFTQSDI